MYVTKLKKAGTILSIIATLATVFTWVDSRAYNRALSDVSKDSADKISKATKEAIEDAELRIIEAQKQSRVLFDAELASAKKEQKVEVEIREVIKNVESIKYVNDCGVLNSDSIELLNKVINSVNSST